MLASPRRTFPEVCVDAHGPCGAGEALVLAVRDVLVGLRVDVLLGQAKVNDVDNVLVRRAVPAHEVVFWLHVSVYQVFAVHILYSGNLGRRGGRAKSHPP